MTIQQSNALSITLPSDREIRLTRAFNAPRSLVYQAITRPEHVRQWWGPRGTALSVCEMDFRVGGAWRFVLQDSGGGEHVFKGVYKEIVPPERLVNTFIYDVDFIRDFPAVETVVLEERDHRTYLTTTVLHMTKEARDGHIASGMESGATDSMDRLEELLESLA